RGFPDVSEARKAERAERAAQLRLGERLRRAQRLVHGGEDGVLEQLRVVGVDRLRVDVDLLDLSGAGRLHGDEPAAGRGLDHLLRQLLLRLLHLCLHLLRLPEQLVHVEALARHQSSTSRASNVSLIRATKSSSRCSPFSPSTNSSRSRRPVTSKRVSASRFAFFSSSASCRWKAALAGNSRVSRSSASAAGCASRIIDAVGIERRSSAGSTVRCHASWSCSSSSEGGAGVGDSVPSGALGASSCGTLVTGTVPGAWPEPPRCSRSSSR